MDMEVICSEVKNGNVVTLEMGINPGGKLVYGISWWKRGQLEYAWYHSIKTAYATFSMICRMI